MRVAPGKSHASFFGCWKGNVDQACPVARPEEAIGIDREALARGALGGAAMFDSKPVNGIPKP